MSRLAIYPGTFDPFTLGHLDVAQRAARLFDLVEITVAVNPDKTASMPAVERAALIRQVVAGTGNLSVRTFEGLVAPYACARGAAALVRGVRTACDFTYEAKMAMANSRLCQGLETVCLISSPEHAHTSAGLVRDIAQWGGDLAQFVPPVVAEALRRHYATRP